MKSPIYLGELPLFDNVLKLCNLLGVATPRSGTWRYRSFAGVFLIFLICGATVSFFGKLGPIFESYHTVIKIADEVANVFLTLAVTTTVVQTVGIFPRKLREVRGSLLQFDGSFGASRPCRKLKTIFWIMCPIVVLSVLTLLVLDTWIWLESVTVMMYKYYFVRNIQYCQLTATMLLWFWLAIEIYHRFAVLNGILNSIAEHSTCCGKSGFIDDCQGILRKVSEYHNFLCKVVNDVNDLFGVIILFYNLFVIAYMVQYTLIIIEYTLLGNGINAVKFGGNLAFVGATWVFGVWLKAVFISTAGHFVAKEANKTKVICYNILNNIKTRTSYERLKDDLKDLSEQVARCNPCLTASGFFVVNLTMLGYIVSSVTSYIIVAVQFL